MLWRAMVLLLVLLNGAYLGWHYYYEPARLPARHGQGAQSVPGLTLLTEATSAQLTAVAGGGAGQCLFIGGLQAADAADQIRQRLFGLGVENQLRQIPASTVPDGGPAPTAGEGDYWLQIDGKFANQISEAWFSALKNDLPGVQKRWGRCLGVASQ